MKLGKSNEVRLKLSFTMKQAGTIPPRSRQARPGNTLNFASSPVMRLSYGGDVRCDCWDGREVTEA